MSKSKEVQIIKLKKNIKEKSGAKSPNRLALQSSIGNIFKEI